MILVFRYIFPKPYVGLTLWPLIILKERDLKDDRILINHERIHLRQQLELLIIPFYILYFLEWLLRLIKYKNAYRAYKNISFEKEAYLNETDEQYLKHRKFWGFFSYYFNNT